MNKRLPKVKILPVIVMTLLGCQFAQAGTMGQITPPTKLTPYCEYMPFDFVDRGQKFSTLHHRIWVK